MSEVAQLHKKESTSSANRLRLEDLPLPVRRYATALLLVVGAACSLILLKGLFPSLEWASVRIPPAFESASTPAFHDVSYASLFLFLIGFGFIAAALVFGTYLPGWKAPTMTRLGICILTVLLPLHFLRFGVIDPVALPRQVQYSAALQAHEILISLALVCGIAALIFALVNQPHSARWVPALVLTTFAFLALALLAYRLWWNPSASRFLTTLKPVVTIYWLISPFVGLSAIFFFWQLIAEAKIFTREIGLRVANWSARLPLLLAVIFAAKLVWLAVGLWGKTADLEGNVWQYTLKDLRSGTFLIAAVFGVAAAWLLMRPPRSFKSDQQTRSAVAFTLGFSFFFLAAWLSYFTVQLLLNIELHPDLVANNLLGCFTQSSGSLRGAAICAINGLTDMGISGTIIFVLALVPIAWVLSRSPKFHGLAPLFLVAGIWSLPFAISTAAYTFFGLEDFIINFGYLTFDIFLTLALLFFTVRTWKLKENRVNLWMAALVLVVSTLHALWETLIPETYENVVFAFLLIVPIAYTLFFDADYMNKPGPERNARLLRTLGLQAGVMVIVAWAYALGMMGPGINQWEAVAERIFLPAFLFIILLSMKAERNPSPTH